MKKIQDRSAEGIAKMLTSYHVHTRFSDGEGEIIEFVSAARRIGLAELGLSDHCLLTPDGRRIEWAMPLDKLDEYVEGVRSAAGEAADGPAVRLGIEADYFPETRAELAEVLGTYPFDYVIGAVHFLDGFPIDQNAENWERLTQSDRDEIIRRYWVRMREMAESGLFDVAGHLDLTKKFQFQPSVDLSREISATLDSIARAGMSVEVSTAGWYAPCGEAYPAPSIIRQCLERRIPVLVTADAHSPANLTRGFDRAYALVRGAGYTELASYAGRRRVMRPLAQGK